MNVVNWIGLIGGAAGLIALGLEGYRLWMKRRPSLTLFVPYHFTGDDASSRQRMLFALVRISNHSERTAYLYLETLRAEVKFKGRWYPMSVPSFPPSVTFHCDLPETIQHHAGVKYIRFFNKFDPAVIALDKPFSRYFGMTCHDRVAVENAERLRLEVKDCNLVRYIIEADIQKNDPEH